MSQFAFAWPQPASYAPEDYMVSTSNKAAKAFVDAWPGEGRGAALVYGDPSCGKSHLARCWLARTGGVLLDKGLLGSSVSETVWPLGKPAVLEDIERVADEEAFFHLLRQGETTGGALMMTSSLPPGSLPFSLPDLRSRLAATVAVAIEAPDEALLELYIAKRFSDLQWRTGHGVVPYIARRIERSFAAAAETVGRIERVHMQTRGDISIPLVKKVIG